MPVTSFIKGFKMAKSKTEVTTTHVYSIIFLLILIATLVIYLMAAGGVFAGRKFSFRSLQNNTSSGAYAGFKFH